MKKLLTAMFATLMLMSAGAFAEGTPTPTAVSLEGLSADQVKAVQTQIEQAKRQAKPELTAMDTAVELGRIIGSGLVATARELGIAANDFAKSDLGKVVMYILIWKYLGQDLLGVAIGVPLLITGVIIGLRLVRTASWAAVVKEYATTPVLWGMFSVKRLIKHERKKRESLTDADNWQTVAGYAVIVLSVIVGMNTIF
jgi:hypothetical protein